MEMHNQSEAERSNSTYVTFGTRLAILLSIACVVWLAVWIVDRVKKESIWKDTTEIVVSVHLKSGPASHYLVDGEPVQEILSHLRANSSEASERQLATARMIDIFCFDKRHRCIGVLFVRPSGDAVGTRTMEWVSARAAIGRTVQRSDFDLDVEGRLQIYRICKE